MFYSSGLSVVSYKQALRGSPLNHVRLGLGPILVTVTRGVVIYIYTTYRAEFKVSAVLVCAVDRLMNGPLRVGTHL